MNIAASAGTCARCVLALALSPSTFSPPSLPLSSVLFFSLPPLLPCGAPCFCLFLFFCRSCACVSAARFLSPCLSPPLPSLQPLSLSLLLLPPPSPPPLTLKQVAPFGFIFSFVGAARACLRRPLSLLLSLINTTHCARNSIQSQQERARNERNTQHKAKKKNGNKNLVYDKINDKIKMGDFNLVF